MTEAQLETLVNTLLASGQPDKIIASKHRQVENAIIDELFDVQSRGDLFNALVELLSYAGTEKIFVIKDGVAKLLSVSLIGSASLTGVWVMKGSWDASTNNLPSLGDATIKAGFTYENGNHSSTTLTSPDGNIILPYCTIRALIDNPGNLLSDQTKWRITY